MNSSAIRILFTLLCLAFALNTHGQAPTIGLLHNSSSVSEGYLLFTPELNNGVFLVDNCGMKINEWTFSEIPGLTCYLLEDGTLLRAGKDSLEIRDWDNTLLWSYATTANGFLQHHDIQPLPNGNILMVVSEFYSDSTMLAEGRNPADLSGNLKLDQIIEIEPVGMNSANVVWQWRYIDHLVQDLDSSKSNYDVVENHPELLDINYDNGYNLDWTHVNSVAYNSSLDQILISARHLDEIYIIDHSTTTLEAAGHAGGTSGKGGDFLWRWGNPQVYRQGTSLDQQLFKQHDAKWVAAGFVDEDKISVFNNGGNGVDLESYVHLIEPEIVGGQYTMFGNKFSPATFDWTWGGLISGQMMYQWKKSGCQSLVNGNILITETALGTVSEIMKNGDLVWSYRNPTGAIGAYDQFDIITLNGNSLFRAEKYDPSFPGFFGKDLTPQGLVEDENVISDSCLLVNVEEETLEKYGLVNPIIGGQLQFSESINTRLLSIKDIQGREVFRKSNFIGNQMEVVLNPGIYLIQIELSNRISSRKIVVR